jgi:hypothetical protein
MALSRKTKIILIVGSILVVAGGIGAYFLLRKPRDEEGDGEGDKERGFASFIFGAFQHVSPWHPDYERREADGHDEVSESDGTGYQAH